VDAGNLRDAGLLTAQDEQAGRNPFAESGRAAYRLDDRIEGLSQEIEALACQDPACDGL
jgi:hypothetical protein